MISKPKIIFPNNKPFKQKVCGIGKNHVRVMSNKGNIYPVPLSIKAKTYDIEVGDYALVKVINGKWIVEDIEKKVVEEELTPEEWDLEAKRQIEEMESFEVY